MAPDGFGGLLDCIEDARMSATTADVALERSNDVRRIGMRIFLKQGDAAHDEAGSAIGALEGVLVDEGLLNRMELAVLLEAFNGEDGFAGSVSDGKLAGTARSAVDKNGAGAALAFAAAVFRAGKAEFLAEDVEESGIAGGGDRVALAVDVELDGVGHTGEMLAGGEENSRNED